MWLLETFDPDLGPNRARCALGISRVCATVVDANTLTVDRKKPGGSYRQDNIQPACRACQNTQGALITWERRYEWRQWMEEAEAAGIEWDGQLV